MTCFGSFLGQVIVADFDGSQKRFSDSCGIKPPQISRYINSDELPSPDRLGLMLHAIRDGAKKVDLYQSYLSDLQGKVKDGIDFEVSVRLRDQPIAKIDREIDTLLAKIREQAMKNPKCIRILKDVLQWFD